MTSIFIIILNFNGGGDIIDCLDSLKHEKANIVVVDNGSTDSSVDFLKGPSLVKDGPYQKIKLIENERNLGFAAGMNVGIKYALKNGAETVLLLNQDTVMERGFLEALVKNPAGIVAPVIKFKRKGEWFCDFGGRVNWWLGRPRHKEFLVSAVPPSEESVPQYHVGYGARRPPRRRDSNSFTSEEGTTHLGGGPFFRRPMEDPHRDRASAHSRCVIDYVSGCAMLIKRPVFEKIGFLDEKFFLYFEDIDFCLRARKAGFKIAVESKSMITHKLSEKKKKPLKQHFHHLKSNLIFVNRYLLLYRRPIAYIYLVLLLFKVMWNQILGEIFFSTPGEGIRPLPECL